MGLSLFRLSSHYSTTRVFQALHLRILFRDGHAKSRVVQSALIQQPEWPMSYGSYPLSSLAGQIVLTFAAFLASLVARFLWLEGFKLRSYLSRFIREKLFSRALLDWKFYLNLLKLAIWCAKVPVLIVCGKYSRVTIEFADSLPGNVDLIEAISTIGFWLECFMIVYAIHYEDFQWP